jgi:dTDP-4-dehydrorhamnose reductase
VTILVLGSGFIGREIADQLTLHGKDSRLASINATGADEYQIDIRDPSAVRLMVQSLKPKVIVNAVGLAGYLQCEENSKLSYQLNVLTCINLSKVAAQQDIKLVYLSSSYVFNGCGSFYSETDPSDPQSIYGEHKVEAENAIISTLDNYIIVRLDTTFGFDRVHRLPRVGKNLIKTDMTVIRGLFYRTPISVTEAARLVVSLLVKDERGVFHIAGTRRIELLEFYKELCEESGFNPIFSYIEKENCIILPPFESTLDTTKMNSKGYNLPSYLNRWL